MKKQLVAGEAPQLVQRLTFVQRQQMLACLLSDKRLFTMAAQRLLPKHFNQPDEVGLFVVWTVAVAAATAHGSGILFDDRAKAWQVVDTEAKGYFA